MADEPLELEFPIMRYDITLPLLDGRVQIDGVKLKPVRIPAMIFNEESPYKDGSFGLGDLNVMYWLPAIEAGWPLVGLPLWIKRKPVYEYLSAARTAGSTPRKTWKASALVPAPTGYRPPSGSRASSSTAMASTSPRFGR